MAGTTLDRVLVRAMPAVPKASVKMTGLGLALDRDLCEENVRSLVAAARECSLRVELDMEDSTTTTATLDVPRSLREQGFDNIVIALQAYLRRTLTRGRRVRGYRLPRRVAALARARAGRPAWRWPRLSYGADWHAHALRRFQENPKLAHHVAGDLLGRARRRVLR